MVNAVGPGLAQRARVTTVTNTSTGNVMAVTVLFEPTALEIAGGTPDYDPIKAVISEIAHFRNLFPGLTN